MAQPNAPHTYCWAPSISTARYDSDGYRDPPLDPDECTHEWLKNVRPWPRTDFHVGECSDCKGTFCCDELGRVQG